ncbi:Major egg antigen [Schistosoma japonicum]|uniref:Major egg antigen n=1 Tax=Schistosoma japonicum TaxID=6182 RepID=A0A4Z2D4P5_SCHJA|nr:Major egg antigen [Schistosoma japonicum]
MNEFLVRWVFNRKSASQIQAVPASQALTVKGCQGLTVLDDGAGGKKLHVEVQLDPVYPTEDLV